MVSIRGSVILAFLCLQAGWGSASADEAVPTRRAVLIGIDNYLSPDIRTLEGAVNDVEAMRAVLVGKFGFQPGDIVVLKNEQATRAGTLRTIRRHLIEASPPPDIAVIHFSGHGSRVADVSGDEIDGWDETLVVHDARIGEVFDLTDDEIGELLDEISVRAKQVVLVIDSCHSGTIARDVGMAGVVARTVAPDLRRPPPSPKGRAVERSLVNFRSGSSRHVLIAGSRSDELSHEASFGGRRQGALTHYLVQAMLSSGASTTYRDLADSVSTEVAARFPSQHPQLDGLAIDNVLFGLRELAPRADPDAAARALLATIVGTDAALRVHVQLDDASRAARVRSRLAEHDSVAEASVGEAQVRAYSVGSQIAIDGFQGKRLMTVDASAERAEDLVADAMLHWARWHRVLSLDNPTSDLPIELRIQRSDSQPGDPQPEAVADGTSLTVRVTNRSKVPLHIVMLGLFANGQVCVLAPTSGSCRGSDQQELLAPGASVTRPIKAGVPDGQDRTYDIVKVLATTQWISPRLFELPSAPRSREAASRGGESALEKYIRRAVQGARQLEAVSVDGWSVRQRRIEIYRAVQREMGYALHFDGPASEGLQRALSRSRGDCQGPRCTEVTPFRGDPSMVEVRSETSRSTAGESLPVGKAFDEAYRLADETGAARAEPLFSYERTAPVDRGPGGTRGGGSEKDDPRAAEDVMWSLKQARVPEAWHLLRNKPGTQPGAEAAGIVIAHPDTGYLKHPEIWPADPSLNPILPDKGYDYYGEDEDPTDDLLDGGLLDNPAHGTGSGSAIVSPAGCQVAGALKCPTGVAAGARMVPLRIGRSVVHFDTRRMTQAILDASGQDRSHVKVRTDVMSLSMGGLPSWALWKAVKAAEMRGLLIVAASGNYVGTVVWPARFESVISAAATNVGCKPWPFTSMGSKIDISAPGESVWRATIDDSRSFVTGMGAGTTYATANTAGVAALWVALHRGTPRFEEIKQQGQTVRVFRRLLRQTATRPAAAGGTRTDCDADAPWNAQLMGPGIVDAAALLAQPLPGAATPKEVHVAGRLDDLPLWASVYAPGTALPTQIQDYRRLFALDPKADMSKVVRFEAEVLHHYATEPSVTRSLDRIALAGDRSNEAFRQLRASLRQADLSNRLREFLPSA